MKPPPTVPPFSSGEQVKGTAASDLPVFGDAMIHWNGQSVAVVVAETLDQAEYAASLVHVEYDVQPARLSFDALKSTASAPYDTLGDPPHVEIGHAESALAQAAVAVDHVYRMPRHNHNAMEPHATIAVWGRARRSDTVRQYAVRVWGQGHALRGVLARPR